MSAGDDNQSSAIEKGREERRHQTELAVLQAVRLKGRVSGDDLAATLGEDISPTVDPLIEAGLLVGGSTLRVSPDGRGHLDQLLATERGQVDAVAIAAAYDEFRSVNIEFKQLVTDWQLKAGQPNAHDDPDYDAAVLARLDQAHQRAVPIVAAAAAELPRLSRYSTKLHAALDRVRSGDTMWLSRPLIDSYHTVWFELHEELILAAGLKRETEDA